MSCPEDFEWIRVSPESSWIVRKLGWILLIASVLAVLALGGCRSPDPAVIHACDTGIDVGMGHVVDESLPRDARLIAGDYVLLLVEIRALAGDPLPDEVEQEVRHVAGAR